MIARQGMLDLSASGLLQIDWKILSACNYRCSYCFDQNKPAHEDICLENIFKTAQKILDLKRMCYNFRFVGGEPSLFGHLQQLIEYIHDKEANVFFEIISNGSQPRSYFRRLFANLPDYVCRVHISVHLEYAQKFHIARIIETIVSLRQHALARVMFHPLLREKSIDFAGFLLRLSEQVPFEIRINALRQPPDFINFDSRYTSSDFAAMNRLDDDAPPVRRADRYLPLFYNEDAVAYHLPHSHAYRNGLCNFKDFTCMAGTNTMHIDTDLHWRPATCFLFAQSHLPFYADGENLHPTMTRCAYAQCGCDANYIIPKFQNPTDALRYQAQLDDSALHQL